MRRPFNVDQVRELADAAAAWVEAFRYDQHRGHLDPADRVMDGSQAERLDNAIDAVLEHQAGDDLAVVEAAGVLAARVPAQRVGSCPL